VVGRGRRCEGRAGRILGDALCAAGAGGGDGAAMIDAGAAGAGGANWTVVDASASVSRTGDATGVGGAALV